MPSNRREFCVTGLCALGAGAARGQGSARVDVAGVERNRVLVEAAAALEQTPRTLAGLAAPKDSGAEPQVFYSETEVSDAKGAGVFRAHTVALADFSTNVSALTAAYVLTREERYALQAGKHLYAWFVDPATRMTTGLEGAGKGRPVGILDGVPLAEVARALPFLADTAALSPPDVTATRVWFRDFLRWLNTARSAMIARDMKDHTASAWLLLCSASARLLADEATLSACRLRFKKPTMRNQVAANGDFPHEVVTPFPLRNTLMNFDLLTGVCELLATPFASLWDFELEDGPGMRSVAAFLYPLLKEPARWLYPADASHFREVPRRRPGLLFAGRAYNRPEYVELWRTLPAPAPNGPLRESLPIRQPLLWVTRAPHGM